MISPDSKKKLIQERFDQLKNDAATPLENLLVSAQMLVEEAHALGQLELECEILIYLGRGHRLIGNAFKSISSLNRAYVTLNSNFLHKKDMLAQIFRQLCNVYSNSLKDHLTAIDYCFKGYKLNVKSLNSNFLNNIGSNYMSMAQYDNAALYFNKGVKSALKHNNEMSLSFLYHNCGELELHKGNYKASLPYFEKTKILAEKLLSTTKNQISIWNCNFIYSYSLYCQADALIKLNRKQEANILLESGKKFCIDKKQFQTLSDFYLLEGNLLISQNDFIGFNKLFEKAIDFCTENSLLRHKQEWLNIKQDLHEKNGDYKSAFDTIKKIIENTKQIKTQHQEFNISQILVSKEEEILSLENKNRIMQLHKEELNQFAYIVTHDLKTPLSNISNFAGLFRKKYKSIIDEKGKEYLDYIIGSAQNLTTMLSDLLEYISLEDQDNKDFEEPDLSEIIHESLAKNKVSNKQYSLKLDNIQTVPIRAFHLEIMFDNLIKNANEFKRDNIPLEIEIEVAKIAEEYIFKVSDNGIGIEDKYKSQVFEIFNRLNKKNSSATGIGLSICKKIAQSYMGNIWVEDNDKNGCSFIFTISSQ